MRREVPQERSPADCFGQVDSNGTVTNQSGTVLGSVDGQGNAYNVSGTKVGSVQAGGNIALIGGAARLLFFGVK